MSVLGGWKNVRNPGLDPALGYLEGARTDVDNTKAIGNKFGRNILKGLMRGDTSLIGNPFLSGQAAADRMAEDDMDPMLDPAIASARVALQKNRNAEQAGVGFENYVRGMADSSADRSVNFAMTKMNTKADLAKAMADASIRGNTQQQTQGWLGAALGAVRAGTQVASMFMPPT